MDLVESEVLTMIVSLLGPPPSHDVHSYKEEMQQINNPLL